MKYVYIVTGGWDYEGFEIVGVYSNRLDAEESEKKAKENYDANGYDWTDTEEWEIN